MQSPKAPLPTLPLHLMMMTGWLSSLPASPLVKNASQSSKQPLSPKNLQAEAASHVSDVLRGVLRYLDAPTPALDRNAPAIWKRGNARLLNYGAGLAKGAPVVLFVPSLINRHYILDLTPQSSLLGFLNKNGIHPYVLDWGQPGQYEQGFGCEAYINNILLPAIRHLHKQHGKKITLAGYCMGGVFSLAAAQLLPAQVECLALLATPWNFHCKAFEAFLLDEHYQKVLASLLDGQENIPAAMIQALFTLTDPWVFEQKFRRFYELKPGSKAAQEFIALERWVNDGVPMTSALAKDCLLGWAQQNQLHEGRWKVAGKIINPKKIQQPALIAYSQHDHIVPPDCAKSLAMQFPQAALLKLDAGHVSMIVGGNAKKQLWQPFAAWLTKALDNAA